MLLIVDRCTANVGHIHCECCNYAKILLLLQKQLLWQDMSINFGT